jgi:Rieske 2Fe-2S family protein
MERSLPSACYTAGESFAREREGIFFREWFCIGREEEVPSPGDVLVLDVAGESVLLARGRDGALHAHYNVCRHRGARLCAPGEGEVNPPAAGVTPSGSLRCRYHSWTYALDGRLLSAPHLGADFPKQEFGLHPVGVQTWGGFVFVHLTPREAKCALRAQLGPAPERLARYPLAELRQAHRIVYDVEANWKVVAENYNECYHCAGVHPELCEVVPAFGRGGAQLDWDRGIPHRDGAFTFTKSGTTSRQPFPGLDADERVRHKGELVYPNLFLSLSADHVAAFLLQPRGPERTRIVCEFLFDPAEIERPGFDPSDAVEFWDLINRQDWTICEEVQRGIHSRVHAFGYYAPMEDLSLDIRRYVTDRVGEPGWRTDDAASPEESLVTGR